MINSRPIYTAFHGYPDSATQSKYPHKQAIAAPEVWTATEDKRTPEVSSLFFHSQISVPPCRDVWRMS